MNKNLMLIFLARIPNDTTETDIINFLNPVLKGGLFFRKGMIKSLEIMLYQDDETELALYHALVRIEPDNVAQRVITKLNRKPLKGKHILVREYQIRSWHNDPRLVDKLPYPTTPQERRTHERRKHQLQPVSGKKSDRNNR